MPYSSRIKSLAYQADPACWKSYSGMPPEWKRRIEHRRIAALDGAARIIAVLDKIKSPTERPTMSGQPYFNTRTIDQAFRQSRKPRRNPPLKVQMLLHFHYALGPFAPETTRTSPAYTQFVRELLRAGLIERPTSAEREEYPGFAYRTTAKGDALVNAICAVPDPVEKTRWVIPA